MAVPEETVLSFVRSSIRSAWALELLLLLHRHPERSWSIDDLVRELRGSLGLVSESLQALAGLGLVARSEAGAYAYRYTSVQRDELVAALAELYAQKPTTVLKTIFMSPHEKIRSFSDAFLIRRGEGK